MQLRLLLVIGALAFGIACKSEDPKKEAASDVTASAGQSPEAPPPASTAHASPKKMVAPPKPGQRPKLTVGSWTTYHILTPSGEKRGEASFAVLEVRNDHEYLVEASVEVTLDLVAQAWIEVKDPDEPQSMQLLELKGRTGTKAPEEQAVDERGLHSRLFDKFLLAAIPPKLGDLPQHQVEVPAGLFRGCYEWTDEQTIGGEKVTVIVETHPTIPAPAMARHVSPGAVWALADYGDTGADSKL